MLISKFMSGLNNKIAQLHCITMICPRYGKLTEKYAYIEGKILTIIKYIGNILQQIHKVRPRVAARYFYSLNIIYLLLVNPKSEIVLRKEPSAIA
jgi:hypothetical protein